MSFETAMVNEFSSIPGIGSKVFPLVAPVGTVAPYVVYGSSEGLQVRALDGYKDSKMIPVDINIVADSYGSMKQSAAAIIAKVIGFQQRAIGSEGLFIQEIDMEEPREVYEDEARLHKSVFSFTVHI